jgi:hypothetical protein
MTATKAVPTGWELSTLSNPVGRGVDRIRPLVFRDEFLSRMLPDNGATCRTSDPSGPGYPA